MLKLLPILLALHHSVTISKAAITGPYKMASTTLQNVATLDSSDQRVNLHYPVTTNNTPINDNHSFPLIAYAHGLDNAATDYTKLFESLVSFGFIVAAHWSCLEGCSDDKTSLPYDPPGFGHYYQQQLLVVDWMRNQTSLPCSINFTVGVAIAGHSMGGQSTLFSSSLNNASQHGIVVAAMHHAFTHEYPAPSIPFLAFTGSEDVIAWSTMTEKFYNAAAEGHNQTRGYINKADADHFEPEDPFFPFYYSYNPMVGPYTAAFFKLIMEKKKIEFGINYEEMIYGNSTTISICHGGDGKMTKCEMHV